MKLYTLFAIQVLLISLYAAKVDDNRWQILNARTKRAKKNKNHEEYDDEAFYQRYDINDYEDISENALTARNVDIDLEPIDKTYYDYSDYNDVDKPVASAEAKGIIIRDPTKINAAVVKKIAKFVKDAKQTSESNAQKIQNTTNKTNKKIVTNAANRNVTNKVSVLKPIMPLKRKVDKVNENINLRNGFKNIIKIVRTEDDTQAIQVVEARESKKLQFIYNLQCSITNVLCFIVNWNETMSLLLDNDSFKECFRIKNTTHISGRDRFKFSNILKQLTKLEIIDYFLETLSEGNLLDEQTKESHRNMNCNTTLGNMNMNKQSQTANSQKTGEMLSAKATQMDTELVDKINFMHAFDEQLKCEQNTVGLEERIGKLTKHAEQIKPLYNLSGTANDAGDATNLPTLVKTVQALILQNKNQSSKSKVCDIVCCDKCITGLLSLQHSANNTIHQLYDWTSDSFKQLFNWYKETNETQIANVANINKDQQQIDKLEKMIKNVNNHVNDLKDKQLLIKNETETCCQKLHAAFLDINDKLAQQSDRQQNDTELFNKQIEQVSKQISELAVKNDNQAKDAALEQQKLTNITDNLKALEEALKRSNETGNRHIKTIITRIEILNNTVREVIENPKYKSEFDVKLKALTEALNQLNKQGAANEKQLQNKINELETNLTNAGDKINANMQQIEQCQAVNELQSKQQAKLQQTIEELQNNALKICEDRLTNAEEQIRNVSQQQMQCCAAMDVRLDDLANASMEQQEAIQRIEEILSQTKNASDELTAKRQADGEALAERFKNTTKDLNDMKNHFDRQADNFTAKLDELVKNLVNESKLNDTLEKCNHKIAELRSEYEKEIAELKAANESAVKRIDNLEKQLKELSDAQANTSINDELGALKARLDQLESSACNKCEAENAKLQEKLNRTIERVDELELKILNISSDNNNNNNTEYLMNCDEVQMDINEDLNQRMFELELNYDTKNKNNKNTEGGGTVAAAKPTKPVKYPRRILKKDRKLEFYFNHVT